MENIALNVKEKLYNVTVKNIYDVFQLKSHILFKILILHLSNNLYLQKALVTLNLFS